MFLGIRDFNAKIVKTEERYWLELEGIGVVSSLEYIKQGCRIIEATPQELRILLNAGYPVRVESL